MAPKRKAGAAVAATPEAFTPQRFERELKDLAAKAKSDTWNKRATEQVGLYARVAVLLTLIGIYSNVSQMALSPVYGTIPTAVWHSKLVMAACFVGWSSNLALGRSLPVKPHLLLPLVAMHIPYVQFWLFKLSGTLTAHWGPLVTESLTLFPLVALSVSCVATYLEEVEWLGPKLPAWIGDAIPGLGSWILFNAIESFSSRYLLAHVGETALHTRIGLELVMAFAFAVLAPSKLLAFGLPAIIHTVAFNTHLAAPWAFTSLETTLSHEGWHLLDRRESLTGYISVVESLREGFRVMRCDHSLLGGEWVKFQGSIVAEPIYGVFVMLEAVRLVKRTVPKPDNEANALVIGLGIGTTPAALVAHGINTTVVEIDPVVHAFAQTYFRLPANHTIVIADAVGYTAKLADEKERSFDYIVHDVFTGGAEPIPLFTLEFLQSLSALLKPDGVIAINYAGDFLLPTPAMVVRTIWAVFPSCRIFRESPRPSDEEVASQGKDFTNMVIFCSKSEQKLSFRAAVQGDFLDSRAREAFLVPEYEVEENDFLVDEDAGLLMLNNTAKLAKWHEKSAIGHWEVMRLVLPAALWENW